MATIPSISMIPSGYKQNKVYSVLPTNGDGDLDFARTSVATRINENGLIEEMGSGVPRLDYSNGSCPSLLLEPQSTNLITYPLSFDNSYWIKSGATVVSGFSAPSVDNPTSAFKLVGENGRLYKDLSVIDATPHILSAYYKGNVGDTLNISIGASTKVITLNGSWQRESISITTTSTFIGLSLIDNRYSGSADGVYIFGAQLEQQPYATSLMLPSTEGSTVTRVADTASLVLPSGITSIIETIDGVEQSPITTIPTTYNVSLGNINQIKMF